MKKTIQIVIFLFTILIFTSACKDFLNVIPDNIPTIEHAFKNRNEAEAFLYGCYSFIPSFPDIDTNPALVGGDEVWLIDIIYTIGNPLLWKIAKGEQNTNEPLANYWKSYQDGISSQGGRSLFTGIRDCNIFLEEIDKPFDLQEWERNQWIAEIKFIKAYLHFWLLRTYGPIPIIKKNLPISATPDKVMVYRDPVDDVVEYIVQLLNESVKDLPLEITPPEMGRASKAIALSLKAQVLTLAASPLFNGNPDYFDVTDKRGTHLFPQEFKIKKWQQAVDALKAAIDTCHLSGHVLNDFKMSSYAARVSDSTIIAMQTRAAVTERWNREIIFGDSNSSPSKLQQLCHPGFFPTHSAGGVLPCYAPPLHIVEQFYTKHGIPIEEDPEWDGIDKFGLKKGDDTHKNYIKKDYTTINLHFNREPRFYGSISFDGSLFFGNGRLSSENEFLHTIFIYGAGGVFLRDRHSPTGYLVKKLISLMTSIPDASATISTYRYTFPIIRLADLYLMYAEALNESKSMPDEHVYEFIDYVRKRSGLEGVIDSWTKYSKFPDKPLTQEGMREIIRQERLNELAFEGIRFWDLRRWKMAEKYMNQPIRGLNIYGETPLEFYKENNLYQLSFELKDYLWPLMQDELVKNKNLIQNPGW